VSNKWAKKRMNVGFNPDFKGFESAKITPRVKQIDARNGHHVPRHAMAKNG